MKPFVLLLLLLLCSCHTAAPVAPLPAPVPVAIVRPQPVPTIAPATPLPRPVPMAPEPRSRQQTQLIEALIDQNDALTARLAALQATPPAPPAVLAPAPAATTQPSVVPLTPAVPVLVATDSTITPNADGVIDLVAVEHTTAIDEPVNPFAVRATPSGKVREESLVVGGIIMGAAPCAMVNERLVQAGDHIERFVVEQIEADAVIVRFGGHRLRLPVSTDPTRVNLPL